MTRITEPSWILVGCGLERPPIWRTLFSGSRAHVLMQYESAKTQWDSGALRVLDAKGHRFSTFNPAGLELD